MALDGTFPQHDQRALTNREAALLHGQWWECSADGTLVWQRLSIKPSHHAVVRHATEELAVARAVRILKRRRVELMMQLEQLQSRFESVAALPMARLIARKSFTELKAQIAAQKKAVDDLPQTPAVERLDPEASCGVFADKITKSIAAEVTHTLPVEAPPPAPTITWPPQPAPVAKAPPIAPAPAKPVPAAHLDTIEMLAAQPFDESLLKQ
ncbi:MAG TPA: hypothetical protein VFB36_04325 [Nevskiaceae bacterium]|nr:hypothetical protein [Nevskiaceae bacterium]